MCVCRSVYVRETNSNLHKPNPSIREQSVIIELLKFVVGAVKPCSYFLKFPKVLALTVKVILNALCWWVAKQQPRNYAEDDLHIWTRNVQIFQETRLRFNSGQVCSKPTTRSFRWGWSPQLRTKRPKILRNENFMI